MRPVRPDPSTLRYLSFDHRRRLIHHQPIQRNTFDGALERIEVDWLPNEAVGAQTVGAHEVFVEIGGREDDDGNVLREWMCANASEDVDARDLWQLQVEQDEHWRVPRVATRVSADAKEIVTGRLAIAHDHE